MPQDFAARMEHWNKRLRDQLEDFDDIALVTLKCHLLLEEALTGIIEKFVFHPDQLEQLQLRFAQKVQLARSLSLDESQNSMWALISALNALRNDLAHALKSPKRQSKIDRVRELWVVEAAGLAETEDLRKMDDQELIYLSSSMCLGFLTGFEREAYRFREFLDRMDPLVNPHRHAEQQSSNRDDATKPKPASASPGSKPG